MNIQSTQFKRPTKGTLTERVWKIADELTEKQGYKAKRQQVIDAYAKEGGNTNTASTQYHLWSQQAAAAPRKSMATETLQLKIEPNGRLLVPAELRELMQLDQSGRVSARIVDGELRIVSPLVALEKLQEQAARLVGEQSSVVEEFLSEKRKEAERE